MASFGAVLATILGFPILVFILDLDFNWNLNLEVVGLNLCYF